MVSTMHFDCHELTINDNKITPKRRTAEVQKSLHTVPETDKTAVIL